LSGVWNLGDAERRPPSAGNATRKAHREHLAAKESFLLMAYALISDVHGNRWALEAVLEDIAKRGVTMICNLGDSVYGPLHPHETLALLKSHCTLHVRGNQDRILIDPEPHHRSATHEYCLERLTDDDLRWLRESHMLSAQREFVSMVHGTTRNDTIYLLEDVTQGIPLLRTEKLLFDEVRDMSGPLVACGHSHVPRVVKVGKKVVVNPGSVGLQAYTDDLPLPHRIENGSPDARYAIVSMESGRIFTELHVVPYDHPAAVALARKNGRDDWAFWLEYGRA
jgi:putative phosphoesterase